jgi:hypothetical protein
MTASRSWRSCIPRAFDGVRPNIAHVGEGDLGELCHTRLAATVVRFDRACIAALRAAWTVACLSSRDA